MTRRRVFKGWSLFFAGFGILVSSCVAHAFDPLTVAAVASAAAGTVNSITDAASEVSASASAFSDLYGEIDSEAVVSEDGQRIVNKIQETENLAREVGYTKEEIDNIIKSQMPLEEKLRHADYVVDNSYSLDKTKNHIFSSRNKKRLYRFGISVGSIEFCVPKRTSDKHRRERRTKSEEK